MKHFLTLLLAAGSLQCFGQIARDSEPLEPSLVSAADAQLYYAQLYYPGAENNVYSCDNTSETCHKGQACPDLTQCRFEVAKGTKKDSEDHHDPMQCKVGSQ